MAKRKSRASESVPEDKPKKPSRRKSRTRESEITEAIEKPQPAPAAENAPSRPAPSVGGRPELGSIPDTVVGFVQDGLGAVRAFFSTTLLERGSGAMVWLGQWGLLAAGVVGFVVSMVLIKEKGAGNFLVAPLWVLACAVLLYVARRFLGAGEKLIASSPTRLGSSAFLDCLGLLGVLAGVGGLIWGLSASIQEKDVTLLLYGVGIFVVAEVLACIALNPSLINVKVEEGTAAGEEAIGVLSFAMKAVVKMVPLVFGLGAAAGTLLFVAAFFQCFGKSAPQGMLRADQAMTVTVYAGLLPLAGYLAFLLYYLTIDVLRAVLSIPGKIDQLSED